MRFHISDNPLSENTVKGNRVAAIVVALEAIMCIIEYICLRTGAFRIDAETVEHIYLANIAILAIVAVVSIMLRFRHKIVPYLLLTALILSAALLYVVIGNIGFGLFIFPLVLSARYYNKNITMHTFVCCLFFYAISIPTGFALHETVADIEHIHNSLGLPFYSLRRMLLYRIFPEALLFILTSVICLSVMKGGRDLMDEEAELAAKNSANAQQLATAAKIQANLLPRFFDIAPNGEFDVYASLKPAKVVSGDFYSFREAQGVLYGLIADVSDKGLPAAMFMMSMRNTMRTITESDYKFDKCIAISNNILCEHNDACMFVTALFFILDYRTGVLQYVNAGHDPLIIRNAQGEVSVSDDEPNTPLGLFEDSIYDVHRLILEPGDTVFLFTDGVTDALNTEGNSYGMQRLIHCIERAPEGSRGICDAVNSDIASYVGDAAQFDDMTMLAMRWHGCNSATVPASTEGTDQLIEWITAYLQRAGCNEDTRRMVDVVVDEVCANIVDYAYEDNEGTIQLDCKLKDSTLTLVFSDYGTPFNPLLVDDPDLDDTSRVGGLGIYLTRTIVDDLNYRRTDKAANELTITKHLA